MLDLYRAGKPTAMGCELGLTMREGLGKMMMSTQITLGYGFFALQSNTLIAPRVQKMCPLPDMVCVDNKLCPPVAGTFAFKGSDGMKHNNIPPRLSPQAIELLARLSNKVYAHQKNPLLYEHCNCEKCSNSLNELSKAGYITFQLSEPGDVILIETIFKLREPWQFPIAPEVQ
jgi:hypothetical protein